MLKKLSITCCLLLFALSLVSNAKIVFTSKRAGTGFYNIYVMNDDGGNLRRLTNASSHDLSPRWISEGQQILFFRDFDPSYKYNHKFFVIDADGRNERLLHDEHPTDDRPAMSPDGEYLAFTSERSGEQDIYVKNLATGQIKQLTHNEDGRMSDRMDWSPDGRKIAYEHRAEAGDSIFIMNANGSRKKLFSPFRGETPFMTAAPRWSPSGRYIMYPEMERTPDFKDVVSVYTVIQNVTTGLREIHLRGFFTAYAGWMGERNIVFSAQENYRDPEAQYDIYRYSLVSKKVKNLTNHLTADTRPDWTTGALAVSPADKLAVLWGELKQME